MHSNILVEFYRNCVNHGVSDPVKVTAETYRMNQSIVELYITTALESCAGDLSAWVPLEKENA